MSNPLDDFLHASRTRLEAHLATLLADTTAPRLTDAMRYSMLGGGKRLRPLLVHATALSLGDTSERWLAPAAAVEMIHAYSLIHDDLPAMDDDDLRRGRPTNHRAFDEATAILAGDALQSLAFEHLSQATDLAVETRLSMVHRLAQGSGRQGMVGGQMQDLLAEGQTLQPTELANIHRLKTGALIETAIAFGALCAQANAATQDSLQRYGAALGLAFQITDDILDVTSDTATLGKPQGSDAARGKSTYVSLLGLDGAREHAAEQTAEACRALEELNLPDDAPLPWLADWLLGRNH
ncbi:polyprenyl synthetase family protein [Saccharospirillum mangrovi]|uniref:polyprenyl synthetase family protein n=1 Tax=Saccharospirillum mangrovi TaxID=2161747 RepID=UPI001E31D3E5|nr:farnesyl diphosphate synthase [Saccharospirillum mangrovi]